MNICVIIHCLSTKQSMDELEFPCLCALDTQCKTSGQHVALALGCPFKSAKNPRQDHWVRRCSVAGKPRVSTVQRRWPLTGVPSLFAWYPATYNNWVWGPKCGRALAYGNASIAILQGGN
jgi:hypothetical protein